MKKLLFVLIFGTVLYSCEKDTTPATVVLVKPIDTTKVDTVKKDTVVKPKEFNIADVKKALQGKWCLTKHLTGFTQSAKTFKDGSFTWEFDSIGNSLYITSDSNYAVIDTGRFTFNLDTNGVCNSKIRLLYQNGQNLGSISFDSLAYGDVYLKMVITGECYDGARFEFEKRIWSKWYNISFEQKKQEMIHNIPIMSITAPQIDISNPKLGQKLVYLNYSYNCNDSLKGVFKYLGDTMVLEVVEKDNLLHFKETFSEKSSQPNSFEPPGAAYYPMRVENSNLLLNNMRSLSGLFYFYGNDTLHLQPNHNAIATQTNCNVSLDTTVFVGNEIASIQSFKVGDYEIKNKTVVSCVPIHNPIINAYLVYDKNKLFASQVYTWDGVAGWVLMDKYR